MAVRRLGNQSAQHDSGAVVSSAGRWAVSIDYHGHRLTLDVERAVGHHLYYLPTSLKWDDGTPIPPETAEELRDIVTQVEQFWGVQAEFREVRR